MTEPATDYAAIAGALRAAGSVTEAAECHGIAVGLMSATRRFAPELWFDHLFGAGYTLTPAIVQCAQQLGKLAVEIDRQLQSEEFELDLFLPDREDLSERVDALATWCQGFLLGISLAEIGDTQTLSADCREFVHDLSAIARASLTPGDAGEAQERDYVELVEYVRIGVLMLREDVLFKS